MNAYDFDNTIYRGDSTWRFFRFCLSRRGVFYYSLKLLPYAFLFLIKRLDKTLFKQRFFGFLALLPDVNQEVNLFWDANIQRIKQFYLDTKQTDDLILSASPEFLLRPALFRLGLPEESLIASKVDFHTGHFDGENCYGEEKLLRLRRERPEAIDHIDAFFSDSLSDAPLACIAKRAFLVRGETLLPWSPHRGASK